MSTRIFCSSYLYLQNRVLFAPPGHHALHHRLLSFQSAQSLLALLEQRALCTFFSLLHQASLYCCGLIISCPGPCASSGLRLPEEPFMVSRLKSQGARSRFFSLEKASPQISGRSRSMRLSSEICGLGFLWAKLAQLELANL